MECQLARKPKYWEKIRLSGTLSTTNPTLPEPNPNRSGGKPTTNRLNYGIKNGCYEHGNKFTGSIIGREFVDPLRYC
jgi:hypothetical protein